jgi:ELP3 family radical SAM enzyme/protein acetyltransferase
MTDIIDIEDYIKSTKQIANKTNKPFDLTYDPKHEIMMDNIYEKFIISELKTTDELKKFIEELKKNIRPKHNLKYGHFNYYYDKGIVAKKYEYNEKLKYILKCNSTRENSGVMVFSIFTSAYPKIKKTNINRNDDGAVTVEYIEEYAFEDKKFSCKYDCHYCPNEPGQPRSYLTKEPGVARATQNNHDPIRQFLARAKQYINQGLSIDKCEIIIQGGTWDSYPLQYREQFVRDIYYVANNFYHILTFESSNPEFDDVEMIKNYYLVNQPKTLLEEIKINENALVRIIGLTPETRPDQIKSDTLINLRNIGATRLQLGIQHINDEILKYVNRRCYYKDTIKAIKILKDNGFKVDGHFMPDLPNPNNNLDMVKEDIKMFEAINDDPNLKLDQIKIYPCMVTPYTKIAQWYNEGIYKPYGQEINKPIDYKNMTNLEKVEFRMKNQLYKNIAEFCKVVHPSIRINRIIRDIPTDLVIGGTKDSSMRSQIEMDLETLNNKCCCIRCRECQNKSNKNINIEPKLRILPYESSGGLEIFISYESFTDETTYKNGVIHSFLRLRLSKDSGKNYVTGEIIFPELINCALIREVHTYGKVKDHQNVDNNDNNKTSQHKGYGKKLIKVAEHIAYLFGYKQLGVIAGVGVREYYRKQGYQDVGIGCYQIKTINKISSDLSKNQINILKPYINENYGLNVKLTNDISYINLLIIFVMLTISFYYMLFLKENN